MSFLDLFRGAPSAAAAVDEPDDPQWWRPSGGYYLRLLSIQLDLGALRGIGGVYVLWHRGVKPGWLYAAATADLGRSLAECRDHPAILSYESRGSVYVTWSRVAPKFRASVVNYLRDAMSLEFGESMSWDDPAKKAAPLAVKFPS